MIKRIGRGIGRFFWRRRGVVKKVGKEVVKQVREDGLDIKLMGKLYRSKRERICREALRVHLEACLEERRRGV